MRCYLPQWTSSSLPGPLHGRYFPLAECSVALADIAYCNAVRCRTVGNAKPSRRLAEYCVTTHFRRWLKLLEPRAVVFIGKWAHDKCHALTDELGIQSDYMNRQRSLSSTEREQNRRAVVFMVKAAIQHLRCRTCCV
jgi:hypothetical protein